MKPCWILVAFVVTTAGAAHAAAQPFVFREPMAGTALAVQNGPVHLTVESAVARAIEASHRLAEIRAREEAAEAAATGRAAAELPELTVLAGYTRTNHVEEFGIPSPTGVLRLIYPDVPDNYRSRLDLQWPIYTGGRLAALERAARAEIRAIDKDLAAARADLRLETTRAYWAVVTANESVRVVREAVGRMDAHLTDVRNRLAAGLIPPNDVLTVEAQRSRQQMLLVEAESTRDVATVDLRRLTGLEPSIEVALDPTLTDTSIEPEGVETLVGLARAGRPEREALQIRASALGERRVAAAAAAKPTIAVNGGVDYARPNPRIFPRMAEWNDSWDASVKMSWRIWDAGRTKADLAEAGANERAAGQRLAEFDTLLELEVRQRALEVRSARAALPATSDAIKSAAEARRVVADRFAAGVATSTDVLDAQVALFQAELDRTRALANLKLAEARLNRAVGR